METSPKITINLLNKQANNGIVWTCSGNKSFGDLSLLSNVEKVENQFMDLSLNRSVLDETLDDTYQNVAFMSDSLSDENCNFQDVWVHGDLPVISDFYTLTIKFGPIYPKKIRIDYYNGSVSSEIIDNIDSSTVYTKQAKKSISAISINFLESYEPSSYAHLQNLLVGGILEIDSEEITEMSMMESSSELSEELKISTLTAEVYLDESYNNMYTYELFSYFIRSGTPSNAQVKIINDGVETDLFLGRFYVNKISYVRENMVRIDLFSLLGVMSKINYNSSPLSTGNLSFYDFLSDVFAQTANYMGLNAQDLFEIYSPIERNILDKEVNGFIPVGTCRDALQCILFDSSLGVLDTRSSKLIIKSINSQSPPISIGANFILSEPKIENKPPLKQVNLEYFVYSLNEDSFIFRLLSSGQYQFPTPINVSSIRFEHQPSVTFNYTLMGAMGIQIDFTSEPLDGVSIYAEKLISDKFDMYAQFNNEDFNGRIISVGPAYLDSRSNEHDEPEYAINLIEYLDSHKVKIEFEYICLNTKPSDIVQLMSSDDSQLAVGTIVYQNIDVARGMVTNCEILTRDSWNPD